jgi:hypothetical protein
MDKTSLFFWYPPLMPLGNFSQFQGALQKLQEK